MTLAPAQGRYTGMIKLADRQFQRERRPTCSLAEMFVGPPHRFRQCRNSPFLGNLGEQVGESQPPYEPIQSLSKADA